MGLNYFVTQTVKQIIINNTNLASQNIPNRCFMENKVYLGSENELVRVNDSSRSWLKSNKR